MANSVGIFKYKSDFINIDELPDDILLEIFQKLSFVDLWSCARVCRRWYVLVRSVRLKRIVLRRHLGPRQLRLLIEHHLPRHLEAFELLEEEGDRPALPTVAPHLLAKLRRKCPAIQKLVLTRCLLLTVNLADMPENLRHLGIRGSEIDPHHFFLRRPEKDRMDRLTCLDLSAVTTCLTSEDLSFLLPLHGLRCLYLANCLRINNAGIESIGDLLPRLRVLDVEGTDVSNEGLGTILARGTRLRELYVGHTAVDDDVTQHINILAPVSRMNVLCLRNTRVTAALVYILEKGLSSQCRLLSDFYSSDDCSGGCHHYLSHSCTDIWNGS